MAQGLITSILVILCLTSCSHYEDDNFIEEYVEKILEDKTGVDIDLTPDSEEIDKRPVEYGRNRDPKQATYFFVFKRQF